MEEGQELREEGGVSYVIVDQKNSQDQKIFFTPRTWPVRKPIEKFSEAVENMIKNKRR